VRPMDLNKLKELFVEAYGKGEVEMFFAPGRVNLIGEHIDYNGGLVLPAALSLGIYGMKRDRDDLLIRLRSKNTSNEVIMMLDDEISYQKKDGWGNYPKGVVKKLLELGYRLKGADIMYVGNLPAGAGLSSSAAIEVLTTYMMLYGISQIDRLEIAKLCQEVENLFIGVNCGIMDQFAVSMGKKDHAILLDSHNLSYEYIPFRLDGYSLLIMDTNKRRELNESKYNERRAECETALEEIRQVKSIPNLCAASLDDVSFIKEGAVRKRVIHAITENGRVKKAVSVLIEGDLLSFGRLLSESHLSLRDNFEVTGFHLDIMVEKALKHPACIGARMTGAGFGGCAIALVRSDHLDSFIRTVSSGYKEKTSLDATFYVAEISDGVKFLRRV